jgi:hypothetical protein
MSEAATGDPAPSTPDTLSVAFVLDGERVVINHGHDVGIKMGQTFLIYELSKQEIVDPATGESLGLLEIPKGMGRVVNVQDHMATLAADDTVEGKMGRSTKLAFEIMGPFGDVKVGDEAKPLS